MSFALVLCPSTSGRAGGVSPLSGPVVSDGDGARHSRRPGAHAPRSPLGRRRRPGERGVSAPGPVVSDGSRRQGAHAPRSPFGSAEDRDAVLVALLKTLCLSCPSLPVGETRETRGTNECRPINVPSDTGFTRNSLIPLEISDGDPPKSAINRHRPPILGNSSQIHKSPRA
jgi:hypothetical protein